jgi:hypothetical protein
LAHDEDRPHHSNPANISNTSANAGSTAEECDVLSHSNRQPPWRTPATPTNGDNGTGDGGGNGNESEVDDDLYGTVAPLGDSTAPSHMLAASVPPPRPPSKPVQPFALRPTKVGSPLLPPVAVTASGADGGESEVDDDMYGIIAPLGDTAASVPPPRPPSKPVHPFALTAQRPTKVGSPLLPPVAVTASGADGGDGGDGDFSDFDDDLYGTIAPVQDSGLESSLPTPTSQPTVQLLTGGGSSGGSSSAGIAPQQEGGAARWRAGDQCMASLNLALRTALLSTLSTAVYWCFPPRLAVVLHLAGQACWLALRSYVT